MSGPWDSFSWRTGRKLGRTVYAQRGPLPEDGDPFLGIMDSPQLAAEVVFAHNLVRSMRRQYDAPLRPPTSTTEPATVEGE